MKTSAATLILLTLCLCTGRPTAIYARGLLGERYADVVVGVAKPGDDYVERFDDSVLLLGGDLNWPLRRDIDLHVEFSYEQVSGSADDLRLELDTVSFLGGINMHLRPGKPIDPFLIGRFGVVSASGEQTGGWEGSDDRGDSAAALVLGGGLQFEITEKIAVRPSLTYQRIFVDNIADEAVDDVVLGADVNVWLSRNVFALGGFARGLDAGGTALFLGLGLGF